MCLRCCGGHAYNEATSSMILVLRLLYRSASIHVTAVGCRKLATGSGLTRPLVSADVAASADDEATREWRRALACANERPGEVSLARARRAVMAPGTDETLAALSDPARRPPVPLHDVPAALRDFQPDDRQRSLTPPSLKLCELPGAAALLGCRAPCDAANPSSPHSPADVAAALGHSRLTALREPAGLPWLVTHFRRLVSRALPTMRHGHTVRCRRRLARTCFQACWRRCRPGDHRVTGRRSAVDTILLGAFWSKLHAVAPALIPFARLWYGQRSTIFAAGQRRSILQGEGANKGDALAPGLYALGQHDALVLQT